MKLHPFKFAMALGLAFSISFLICTIIFSLLSGQGALKVINAIFHTMDFSSIMIEDGFSLAKLAIGLLALFIEGTIVGFLIAVFYNLFKEKNSVLP